MKKCIVVSDSFKGTLSSLDICRIAEETVPRVFDACEVVAIPVADGGEGTVDCFLKAISAERITAEVHGPYHEPIKAAYAKSGKTAVIEMAAAAGLPAVGDRKDPTKTTTYGVGELILHAVKSGCTEILLGLGGSATNDGGCGCAAALGAVFTDHNGGAFVPVGGTLSEIAHIDLSAVKENLRGVSVTAMCDVENPLYGKNGAAYIFGPQKGADEEKVLLLDAGLRHLADVIAADCGVDVHTVPGGGAAGGFGAGVLAFLSGALRSGIDTILDTVGFDALLSGTDLVITGEGRIDSQSVQGKVISGIAKRTAKADVPLIAIVGGAADDADAAYDYGVTAIFTTDRAALPVSALADRAERDYRATLYDVLRLIRTAEQFHK